MSKSFIIPAAGMATRMKPLSKGISKAMIPVNGRPLISYVIEKAFLDGDVDEIVIVENEIGDIEEFVSRVYPDKPIKCVQQGPKLGPLHAISVGYHALGNSQSGIVVWLGDTICLDNFDYKNDFVAVHAVPDPHRWCIIDEEGKLYDKPEEEVPSNLALIGVYNFCNRKAFSAALSSGMSIPPYKGEHQIAALLNSYIGFGISMKLYHASEWYDCGELNTYYASKARLLSKSARSFNSIVVDTFYGTVTKSSLGSAKQEKIEAEKQWLLALTEEQSLFCPRVLESPYGTLKMSMEPGIALNEVLVYDNLRTDIWREIIRRILDIHHRVFLTTNANTVTETLALEYCSKQYGEKTRERILEISKIDAVSLPEWFVDFLHQTSQDLSSNPRWSHVMHGDSHLGNIIYDPHSGAIKFVDPRGSFGQPGTQGDMRYDMGKLLQDFYCGYAMIIAKRYRIDGLELHIDWAPGTERLTDFLESELTQLGYDVDLLKRLAILLLVTAIPFHADEPERQIVMAMRGKSLAQKLIKKNTIYKEIQL